MKKKKDLIVIGVLLAVALALHALNILLPQAQIADKTADATLAPDAIEYITTPVPTTAPAAEPTAEPTGEPTDLPTAEATDAPTAAPAAEPTDAPEAAFGPMPRPQTQDVRGHVVLTVGGRQYGEPIAMDSDKIITLKQEDGKINKVHITPDGVYMESSTCHNQDCVHQGEITPENYTSRVLSTFVICLPNNVTIEFVPAK